MGGKMDDGGPSHDHFRIATIGADLRCLLNIHPPNQLSKPTKSVDDSLSGVGVRRQFHRGLVD